MAMLLGSVVLASIGVIVTESFRHINEETKNINLQQDFSLIQMVLSENIRQGAHKKHAIYASFSAYSSSQAAQSSGTCLKVVFPDNSWRIFYKDNSDFKVLDGKGETTLVKNKVTKLIFSVYGNAIKTRLTLNQNSRTISITAIDTFRNRSSKADGGEAGEFPVCDNTWKRADRKNIRIVMNCQAIVSAAGLSIKYKNASHLKLSDAPS